MATPQELYKFNKHRLGQLIYHYGIECAEYQDEIKQLQKSIEQYELNHGSQEKRTDR